MNRDENHSAKKIILGACGEKNIGSDGRMRRDQRWLYGGDIQYLKNEKNFEALKMTRRQ